MIDLHTHLLQGIDDGASTLEESLAILKTMEKRGVTKVALSSHFPIYKYDNYKSEINNKFKLLQEKIRAADLNIKLIKASEILISQNTAELYYNNKLISIGHSDYLLLETSLNRYPKYFFDVIHDLKAMGAKIIIAHPERYHYVQKDYTILYKWLEEYDLKLIFNSSSFLGHHGQKAQATAEKLLRLGLGHLMASDTHGLIKRSFTLDQGLKRAEEIKNGSSKIFKANAQSVLNNKELKNFRIQREEKSILNNIFSFLI
ncbi:tyrosine-protein phosphatase [Halanaerobium hydrogeniformans]|nr:CpsB/CapC family capsule biosynthesis tyrosine phosphatase [Halanaerobium hydrogeniformans]